jgi:lipopolysaccharide export system permease protein
LRRELARSFGATLVVILTIVLTMMLIRTLGLAAGGSVAPQDVVLLLGYTALGHLPMMLALSLFIAVVVTLGRMYRDSEMAIWFASGRAGPLRAAGAAHRLWPVLAGGGACWRCSSGPGATRAVPELRTATSSAPTCARGAGQFQTSRDGSRVFFVEREGDVAGAARNVFMLDRSAERESVTTARSGPAWKPKVRPLLVLDAGQRNEQNNETGEHTAEFREPTACAWMPARPVPRCGARPRP